MKEIEPCSEIMSESFSTLKLDIPEVKAPDDLNIYIGMALF